MSLVLLKKQGYLSCFSPKISLWSAKLCVMPYFVLSLGKV